MDKISLTYFVDFVLKAGTPKLAGVREFKERKDELYTDFYRQVREAIVDMHRTGKPEKVLDDFVAAQRDERRRRIYPSIVNGYRKLLSSAKVSWFDPPAGTYRIGEIEVNVNPELGLVIDGKPHVLKMYFRGEPLSAKRTAVILNLLTNGLEGAAAPGTVFGVLDVRNARIHAFKAPSPRLSILLRGEAASFATIYSAL
ncbi:MAG: hypothetical protein IT372_00815 [Polyangiaceae bacterium]|nr:hypothetical protein [Polyangiaceae bacterium]